jgi:CBS domain-containing protein
MRVEHIMSLNPVTCEVGDPCAHAARLMRDRGVGCVVVLQGQRVAGLLTDRLLATTCLADALDPEGTRVEDVMLSEVACVGPDDSVFTAMDTMRGAGRARRLPVIGPDRELLGLVSISDLALVAQEFMDSVLEEELHRARKEARVLTGAKRFAKRIRRPTKVHRLPAGPTIRAKRQGSRPGPARNPLPRASRNRGAVARRAQRQASTKR